MPFFVMPPVPVMMFAVAPKLMLPGPSMARVCPLLFNPPVADNVLLALLVQV